MVSHIAFMGRSFGYHLIFMGMTKFQEVAKDAKACYSHVGQPRADVSEYPWSS